MDILNKEAWEQKALIKAGAISVQELMQETLARIQTVNPMVNALVDLLNEEDCVNLTSENYALERSLGGMPMAIKDLRFESELKSPALIPERLMHQL